MEVWGDFGGKNIFVRVVFRVKVFLARFVLFLYVFWFIVGLLGWGLFIISLGLDDRCLEIGEWGYVRFYCEEGGGGFKFNVG